MGATLTRAILADGYDSPSAGAEKVSSCAGSPQCAHGSPTSAITADALGEAPARVLRSHMLMPSMSRLPATLPSSEPANAPTRTVPPLRLGALAGALSAALPPGIGPACAVFCTPTQDRILAELGLPADPAWPPSSASDYLAGED